MFEVIIPIVFGCFLVSAFYVAISMALKTSKEKKLYSAMISNPCDKTVLNYINAFNATYGLGSNWVNTNSAVAHRNNQLRQGQGWDIIKKQLFCITRSKRTIKKCFGFKGRTD